MVDIIQISTRSRFEEVIGYVEAVTMQAVETALSIFLGLS